jgi:hypothetical protein
VRVVLTLAGNLDDLLRHYVTNRIVSFLECRLTGRRLCLETKAA